MIEVPYLAEFLNSFKKSSLDDFVDRLFYYTTILFVFFAVVVSARSFTSPIECMMPQEYPGTWMKYVQEFCYVSSTYTVSSLSDDGEGGTRMVQGYYQWVAFMLVIKGLLLCLPNMAWKIFLNTQIIDIGHLVEKAKSLRFVMGDEHKKGLKEITHYLRERLQHQKTKNRVSTAGFGMKSAVVHTVAKGLTAVIVFLELYFINTNFGPEPELFWGFMMLYQGVTNSRWAVTGIFPRLTFCDFDQPILGGRFPRRTVQCALPQNLVNEKIFIFVWFWLATILILSILDIFYVTFTLFFRPQRLRSAKYFFQPGMMEDEDAFEIDEAKKQRMIAFACDMFGPDGMYFLDCIKLNGGSLVASEIATQIIEELYEDTAPPAPSYKNYYEDTEPPTFKKKLDEDTESPTFQTKLDIDEPTAPHDDVDDVQPSPPPHDN